MATIGDLVTNLSVNAGPFNRGLRGAGSSLGGFVSKVGSTIGTLVKFGGAMAGIAGAGSLTLLVKNSLQSIDATAKLADRLGTTTEALTGFGHAAKMKAGLGMEEFGDVFSDMMERIGDVKMEDGGAAEVMRMLQLDATKLAAMKPEESFLQIADAIKGLGTQAEKLHAADTLFGDAGQRLVPLLDQGAAGIREMANEAERLGLTFSRTDAAKIEEANAAMMRIQASVTGAAQQLTIKLAPAIESVANFVTASIVPAFDTVNDTIDDLVFGFQNFGDSATLTLLDLVSAGLHAFPMLQKPIEQVVAFFIGHWKGSQAYFSSIIHNLINGLVEFKNVGEAVAAAVGAAFRSIKAGDIAGAAGAFGDAFIETLANQKDVDTKNPFAEYTQAFSQARNRTLDLFEKSGGLTGLIDDERQRILDRLTERAEEFDKARNRPGTTPTQFDFDPEDEGDTGGAAGGGATPPQFAKALQFGTADAFDAISRAIAGGRETEDKKQTAFLKDIATAQEEQRAALDAIRQNTKPSRDRPINVGAGA